MPTCPICGAEVEESKMIKCEMCFLKVCPNCATEREGMKVCIRCAKFMDMVG